MVLCLKSLFDSCVRIGNYISAVPHTQLQSLPKFPSDDAHTEPDKDNVGRSLKAGLSFGTFFCFVFEASFVLTFYATNFSTSNLPKMQHCNLYFEGCFFLSQDFSRDQILGHNWDKSLESFPP
jgi:hypothetical protein